MTSLSGCLDSSDEVIREVARQTGTSGEMEYRVKAANLPQPVPHTKYKVDWRKAEHESWASLEAQGIGCRMWRSPVSNAFMSSNKILSEGNYTNILKFRTSTFPVKATLARGRKNLNKSCRLPQSRRHMYLHVRD